MGNGTFIATTPGTWLSLSVLWRKLRDVRAVLVTFQQDGDSSIKDSVTSKLIAFKELGEVCSRAMILMTSTLLA